MSEPRNASKGTAAKSPRAAYISPRTRVRANKHDTEGGLNEAQRKAILAEEDRFARSFKGKYEIAGVVDSEGNLNPKGNPMIKGTNKKRMTVAEFDKAMTEVQHGSDHNVYTRADRVKGYTYTHFHPTDQTKFGTGLGARIGASLSGTDLYSAVNMGWPQVRARTGNYVFSLRPKDGNWDASPAALQAEWQNAYNKYSGEMYRVVRRYPFGSEERKVRMGRLNALASHQATRDVAKAHGYIYTRRRVK